MVDLSRRRLFRRNTVSSENLSLPWIKDAESFTDNCTRCGLCVDMCETKIIVNGDGGFPSIDFTKDECTFCYQCAEACPEGLFLPKEESPWQAKAKIEANCLAINNVECRSCSDMCDAMAIGFSFQVGKVAQPEINLDECTGCGACVASCPTSSINVSNL